MTGPEKLFADLYEMAFTRVNRMESRPGDLLRSYPIWISTGFWKDMGMSLPSSFKFGDQIYARFFFQNDAGILRLERHEIRLWNKLTNEDRLVLAGPGEKFAELADDIPTNGGA